MDIFNAFGSILGYILWAFYFVVRNYGVAILLFTILVKLVLFPLSVKQQRSMAASGKIAAYHVVLSAISIFTLPAAWLCLRLGLGVYVSIGGVLIVAIALNSLGRVWFARRLLGMGARAWLFGVMVPVVALTALCGAVGLLPQLWLGPSFWRLLLTTALTEALFLPLAWRFVLDADERAYAQNALRRIAGRFVRVREGA